MIGCVGEFSGSPAAGRIFSAMLKFSICSTGSLVACTLAAVTTVVVAAPVEPVVLHTPQAASAAPVPPMGVVDPDIIIPKPGKPGEDARLAWWARGRFGMFIHFGLYSTLAGEWEGATSHAEWIRTTAQIPRGKYERLLSGFNPVKFDAGAIAKAARQAGMSYICITTKHHDGFCLFDSQWTEWDVMSTPYGKDLLKQLAQACREEGIKLCFYYSIMDWHHPDYLPRREWEQWPAADADFERYVIYMKAQLEELLTGYGDIGVLWFDGQWEHNWNNVRGVDLYQFVRGIQPNIIINSRVGKGGGAYGLEEEAIGDYATPEQMVPAAPLRDKLWETCMTMNGNWGYNKADKAWKPTRELIQRLAEIVGKGGNFLLNVGPKGDGSIPAQSTERLAEIGEWMKTYGSSIIGAEAGPFEATPWGASTMKSLPDGVTSLFLHVFEWPQSGTLTVPGLLNHITSATVLGTGEVAKISYDKDGLVTLTLVGGPGNPMCGVIELRLAGKPDIATAPTIAAANDLFIGSTSVILSTTQQEARVHYTIDGSPPTATSPSDSSTTIRDSAVIRARPFRAGRQVGPESTRTLKLATPRPSIKASLLPFDLRATFYEGAFKSVAEFDTAKQVSTQTVLEIDLAARRGSSNFGVLYEGYVMIPTTGIYRFELTSDDGSILDVSGERVVDNDGAHTEASKAGDIALEEGPHPFQLRFFENSGGFVLKVKVGEVGQPLSPLRPHITAER